MISPPKFFKRASLPDKIPLDVEINKVPKPFKTL